MLAHEAEPVGVVNHETERIFFLESGDFGKFAHGARHPEHAFGDDQHSPSAFFSDFLGPLELLLEVGHVVVAELELLAQMQTDAVQQAGVALGVVQYYVVDAGKGVDSRDYALIAEVEEESVFLFLEVGEHLLEPLVLTGVAGKHARAHRIGQAVLCCGLSVHLADFGMIGQSEIVVKAPVEHLLAVESHVGAKLALEPGIYVITESLVEILSYGTGRPGFNPVKNV